MIGRKSKRTKPLEFRIHIRFCIAQDQSASETFDMFLKKHTGNKQCQEQEYLIGPKG